MSRIQTPTVAVNPNVELASREAPTIVYQPEPYVPETYFDYEQLSNVLGAGVEAAQTFLKTSLLDREMQEKMAESLEKQRLDGFKVGLEEAIRMDKASQVGEKIQYNNVKDYLAKWDYESLPADAQILWNRTLGEYEEKDLKQQRDFNAKAMASGARESISRILGAAKGNDPTAIGALSKIKTFNDAFAFINESVPPQTRAMLGQIDQYSMDVYEGELAALASGLIEESSKIGAELRATETLIKGRAAVQIEADSLVGLAGKSPEWKPDDVGKFRGELISGIDRQLATFRTINPVIKQSDADALINDYAESFVNEAITRFDAKKLIGIRDAIDDSSVAIDPVKKKQLVDRLTSEARTKLNDEYNQRIDTARIKGDLKGLEILRRELDIPGQFFNAAQRVELQTKAADALEKAYQQRVQQSFSTEIGAIRTEAEGMDSISSEYIESAGDRLLNYNETTLVTGTPVVRPEGGGFKSLGWKGTLTAVNPDGQRVDFSEYTITVDGKVIPSITPESTQEDIAAIRRSIETDSNLPEEIVNKAVEWAKNRVEKNLPLFPDTIYLEPRTLTDLSGRPIVGISAEDRLKKVEELRTALRSMQIRKQNLQNEVAVDTMVKTVVGDLLQAPTFVDWNSVSNRVLGVLEAKGIAKDSPEWKTGQLQLDMAVRQQYFGAVEQSFLARLNEQSMDPTQAGPPRFNSLNKEATDTPQSLEIKRQMRAVINYNRVQWESMSGSSQELIPQLRNTLSSAFSVEMTEGPVSDNLQDVYELYALAKQRNISMTDIFGLGPKSREYMDALETIHNLRRGGMTFDDAVRDAGVQIRMDDSGLLFTDVTDPTGQNRIQFNQSFLTQMTTMGMTSAVTDSLPYAQHVYTTSYAQSLGISKSHSHALAYAEKTMTGSLTNVDGYLVPNELLQYGEDQLRYAAKKLSGGRDDTMFVVVGMREDKPVYALRGQPTLDIAGMGSVDSYYNTSSVNNETYMLQDIFTQEMFDEINAEENAVRQAAREARMKAMEEAGPGVEPGSERDEGWMRRDWIKTFDAGLPTFQYREDAIRSLQSIDGAAVQESFMRNRPFDVTPDIRPFDYTPTMATTIEMTKARLSGK